MSFSVDPSEVLQHLNDLGYKNISAEQLKEFIIGMETDFQWLIWFLKLQNNYIFSLDLKRLIKHDLKERNEATDQENGTTTTRSRRSTCSGGNISEGHRTNRSERLYLAPTISFLQKCSLEKKTKRTPREEDQELPPVMIPSRLSSAAQRDADKKSCKMCKWLRISI